MRRARLRCATLAAAAALLPAAAAAAVLSPTWTAYPSGSIDGFAPADIDADGRREFAVVTRGGTYEPGHMEPGVGILTVIDINGATRWSVNTGLELIGYPAIGDFDGDGRDEVAVCESSPTGLCPVYDDDGTLLFAAGPFWYPAMTNGSSAVADVNDDGFDDLVILSFGGEIAMILGPMGTEAWRADVYAYHVDQGAEEGDLLFGHPLIADIDADGTLEVVVGGWWLGGLYVLNALTGAFEWVVEGIGALPQNPTPSNYLWFVGSGPIAANLDGDAALEIVTLLVGTEASAVVAFEPSGSVRFWTELPAGEYGMTSPIAVDANGSANGEPEIYVLDADAVVHQLSATTGARTAFATVGSASWMAPAAYDANFDGLPDLVVGSTSNLYVYNVAPVTQIHSFSNASGGPIYPAPIIGDFDSDGRAEMLLGAWDPTALYKFDMTEIQTYAWPQYLGGGDHEGSLARLNPEDLLSSDPTLSIYVTYNQVVQKYQQTGNTRYRTAYQNIEDAWQAYANGNPHTAIGELRTAWNDLNHNSIRAQTAWQRQQLAFEAIQMFSQYRDRTASIAPDGASGVVAADAALASAQSQYDAGQYQTVMTTAYNGAVALRNWLDSGGLGQANIVDNCDAVSHVYQSSECRLLDTLVAVIALRATYPADGNLSSAESNLRATLIWWPDIVFSNALGYAVSAVGNLVASTAPEADVVAADVCAAMRDTAREFIDDVVMWRGTQATAESQYAAGLAALAAGNYNTAADAFRDAVATARGAV